MRFVRSAARGSTLVLGAALAATACSGPLPAIANEGFWQPLATDHAPAFMYSHSVAYDATRNRLLAYSGYPSDDTRLGDVWALDLAGPARWTRISPAGPTPNTGDRTSMIYDPVEHRMIVFGGSVVSSGEDLVDAWALDLDGTPTWTQLVPVGSPGGRSWAHGIYDAANHRLVVYGGISSSTVRTDTWALSLSGSPTWAQLAPTGFAPNQRWGHTLTYDSVRDRMIVFAGGDGVPTNGLWALSLGSSPAWTALSGPGTPPPARMFHSAIYDPVRGPPLDLGRSGLAGRVLRSGTSPHGGLRRFQRRWPATRYVGAESGRPDDRGSRHGIAYRPGAFRRHPEPGVSGPTHRADAAGRRLRDARPDRSCRAAREVA